MSNINNTILFGRSLEKSKFNKNLSVQICERSLSESPGKKNRTVKLKRRRSKSNSKVSKVMEKLKTKYYKVKNSVSAMNTSNVSKHAPPKPQKCCDGKADCKDYLIFGRNTLHSGPTEAKIESYTIGKLIGKGSYGVVHTASTKNGSKYAIKIILYSKLKGSRVLSIKNLKSKQTFLDDLRRLIDLKHPNVLRLFSVFSTSNEDKIYLIYELASRPLMIIPTTETYNEVEVLFYFHDTINGLKYLHQNKIPHLDIKPTNLLLASDNRIKIADFGLSIIFDENFFSFYTVTGSIGFCAPELLSQNNNDFKLESLYISDIWSLGLTLYCLLYGNLPWLHEDITQVINDIINNDPVFPNEPVINIALYDLLGRMLCKDPNYRITIPEIEEHSWVNVGGCLSINHTQLNDSRMELE